MNYRTVLKYLAIGSVSIFGALAVLTAIVTAASLVFNNKDAVYTFGDYLHRQDVGMYLFILRMCFITFILMYWKEFGSYMQRKKWLNRRQFFVWNKLFPFAVGGIVWCEVMTLIFS